MTHRLSRALTGTLLSACLLWAGCGDPTDSPEDCASNQYFNDAESLCVTCSALVEPVCQEGCGFTLTQDDNGCPMATCDALCTQCEAGQTWSPQTLTCRPASCEAGSYFDAQANACASCPDAPSVCDGCLCDEVSTTSDALGCPVATCGSCTSTLSERYRIEDGQCLLATP